MDIKLPSRFEGSGLSLRKTYHHEYGGHVYQPTAPVGRFIEPYVLQSEAMAYLECVLHMLAKETKDD